MYPVDFPDVDETDLTLASEQYVSSLGSRLGGNEWFTLSQTSKVSKYFFVTLLSPDGAGFYCLQMSIDKNIHKIHLLISS